MSYCANMKQKYAVIDIEATGGTQKVDRIIEIGIVLVDGDEIIDEFSTLINPGISIPPFITKLTGISQKMVAQSPYFHEVAKKIVELTAGRSLVAHNVSFDYRILREEFNRLGYEFKRDTLCTARLTRHYFPDLEKYNLKSLTVEFNLQLKDRHRAADDAMATAHLLQKILKISQKEGQPLKNMSIYKRKSKLPNHIQEEEILDLPNICGVYYMRDEDGAPIYIGKSIKIRTRIRSHFIESTRKTDKMRKLVHSISYENTGSELMAEVFESLEIRKHKPLLNKAKRKNKFDTALLYDQSNVYDTFKISHKSKVKKLDNVLQWFSSKNAAKAYVSSIVQEFDLCGCLCGMQRATKDCITYKIGNCGGAHLAKEEASAYNDRFALAKLSAKKLYQQDMLILDRGRHEDEYAGFLISNNVVSHIGYLDRSQPIQSKNVVAKKLNPIQPLPEIDRIVYRHFYEGKILKKVSFNSIASKVL